MKKVKEIIFSLKDKFLKELFPENFSCYNCSKELSCDSKYFLCDECMSKIIPIKYPCKICGDELNSFTEVCDNCKNRKRYFDYVTSVTTFEGLAKELVYKLKYSGQVYIAKTIGAYIADEFLRGKFDLVDIVICVPCSKEKFKKRGYNQTEEILKEFIKYYNIDYSLDSLVRIRNTDAQTGLTRRERLKNLEEAFEVAKIQDIVDKNILVIDDVITTGSTLDAVAKVLKDNGAKKVYGLTFCHTPLTNNRLKNDKCENP